MNIYNALHQAVSNQEPVCLCIVVHTVGSVPRREGTKMLVYADGRTQGTVGGGLVEQETRDLALQALVDGQARLLDFNLEGKHYSAGTCGGKMKVYIEPQGVKPVLLVLGAGHVGKAVALAAQALDFQIIVSDDRADLCTPELIPGKLEFLPVPMAEIPEHIQIDGKTYIVNVSRGSDVDVEGMPALLEFEPAYFGVIGSLKRWKTTCDALLQKGVAQEKLDKVKSPIGIDIGGETPEEIAISILAEVIQAYRRQK